jgi:hypothetical protein
MVTSVLFLDRLFWRQKTRRKLGLKAVVVKENFISSEFGSSANINLKKKNAKKRCFFWQKEGKKSKAFSYLRPIYTPGFALHFHGTFLRLLYYDWTRLPT